MKRLYVLAQDSALDIDKEKVIESLDPTIKDYVNFGRFPFTPPGAIIEDIIKTAFEELRKEEPDCYILLMTSSMIYGAGFDSSTTPYKLSAWLKSNFQNSFYAVRSSGGYTTQNENIDFGFAKDFDNLEKGIADNILEVYKKIPQ